MNFRQLHSVLSLASYTIYSAFSVLARDILERGGMGRFTTHAVLAVYGRTCASLK